jgi:hypothetical protein
MRGVAGTFAAAVSVESPRAPLVAATLPQTSLPIAHQG